MEMDPIKALSTIKCKKFTMEIKWYGVVKDKLYVKFIADPPLLINDTATLEINLNQT